MTASQRATDGGFGDLAVYRDADGAVRVEGDASKILIDPELFATIDLGVVTVAVEFAPSHLYKLVRRRADDTIEAERLPSFAAPRELSDEEAAALRAEFEHAWSQAGPHRIVPLANDARTEPAMPGDRRGWLADIDEDATGDHRWQPVLQLDGICLDLDIWFATDGECLEWIDREVIGRGLWSGEPANGGAR